jgi:hypothetical protein
VLPLVLAFVGFPRPPLETDALLYGYQIKHVGELNGRWWRLGDDPAVGHPYQTEMARHAGLYEGVDVMLIAAWPSRFLDARQSYYLAAYAALLINGWAAAWLALRLTRSPLWATLAVVLIEWNTPTIARYPCHLHLFKFGWFLLAAWAFGRYLRAPSVRRGAWLGLTLALTLQGSFYLGYLALIALGAWWLGCLAGGRVRREHAAATAAAGLVFATVGFALTFPVWTLGQGRYFADDFLERPWRQTWIYGAELWQYLVPQGWAIGEEFIHEVGARPEGSYGESANFPGFTILLAVALYAAARLRGWKLWPSQARFLDLALGLMGLLVVLSLAGGPSFFLFLFRPFSGFRCYGRAGLLAMALGCILAPAVFQGLIAAVRGRALRVAALALVLAVTALDAGIALRSVSDTAERITARAAAPPAWVGWLARQPARVRLAAFCPTDSGWPMDWWGVNSGIYRLQHGHATLNGGDLRLLQGDLKLLGASFDRMNEAGLRFVVALGYETLAFNGPYLEANPWIASLPWLDWLEEEGGWKFARANRALPALPTRSLGQLLAAQPGASSARALEVPADCWITGRLAVGQDTVVPEDSRVFLSWVRADGKRLRQPINALFQHVFGPSIPAYRVLTPRTPGAYELVVEDAHRHRLAAIPYRVNPALRSTLQEAYRGRVSEYTVNVLNSATDPDRSAPYRIEVENASPLYAQALTADLKDYRSICAHPGLVKPGPTSVHLRLQAAQEDLPPWDVSLTLPFDLPPGGRLALELPADRIPQGGHAGWLTITPFSTDFATRTVPAAEARLRFSLARGGGAVPPIDVQEARRAGADADADADAGAGVRR